MHVVYGNMPWGGIRKLFVSCRPQSILVLSLRLRNLALLGLAFALLTAAAGMGEQTAMLINDTADFIFDVVFGPGVPDPDRDSIKIATWNVENWGKTKSTDPWRMDKIADTLAQYDLVAVQEISNIREISDPGCPRNENDCPGDPACGMIGGALQSHLNERLGLNYSFAFSPQVRDERYLFVYNPEKVKLLEEGLLEDPDESGPACDPDPDDIGLMSRQPFMGVFRAGDFDFMLLNVHTSPYRNQEELEGLERLYRRVLGMGEEDVIIIGDLNADCDYLPERESTGLGDREFRWVVPEDADTTVGRSDCAYDALIITQATFTDFSGSWGIEKGIPRNVSDHYPVWAEFYTDSDQD